MNENYQREYYLKNQKRLQEYRKKWREENKEHIQQEAKKYFKSHKKELYAYHKQRRKSVIGDKIRAYEKDYRNSTLHNFLSHKYSQLKKEKHRGKTSEKYKLDISLEFLEALWINQDGKCAITGKQMIYRKNSLYSCSIDRIDPHYGYYENNVQLVCQGINFAKNKYSDEAIRYFWFNDIEK